MDTNTVHLTDNTLAGNVIQSVPSMATDYQILIVYSRVPNTPRIVSTGALPEWRSLKSGHSDVNPLSGDVQPEIPGTTSAGG